MMDLQAIFPRLIKILNFASKTPTSHMKTTTQTTEDHMINAQISHSKEMMEIDFELDLSTNPMGTGGTMEIFLVLHRLKEETSH